MARRTFYFGIIYLSGLAEGTCFETEKRDFVYGSGSQERQAHQRLSSLIPILFLRPSSHSGPAPHLGLASKEEFPISSSDA